jgi:stage V sporulation protein SpoVS
VILGDVARGGLNQAVIAIEEARGRLLDAGVRAGASPAP